MVAQLIAGAGRGTCPPTVLSTGGFESANAGFHVVHFLVFTTRCKELLPHLGPFASFVAFPSARTRQVNFSQNAPFPTTRTCPLGCYLRKFSLALCLT